MNKEVKLRTHFGNLSSQQLAGGQGGRITLESHGSTFVQFCQLLSDDCVHICVQWCSLLEPTCPSQQLAVSQGGKNTLLSDGVCFCQDCAKGAKDEVKRHEWPPAGSQGPEGP